MIVPSMLFTPNLTNLIPNVATTAGMVVVPQDFLDQLLKLSPGWTLQAIILIIIASGILVIFAAIAILKVWKNHHLNRMRTSLMIKFEKRWKEKEKVRPSMTNCLFQLYKDLRITSKRFYEEYKENDFITEDEKIDDIIARRILKEEIIQPKSIGPPDLIPIIINERNNEDSASVSSPVSMLAPLDEDEQ
jgi:hypothetical protein